ncbi:ABC-F family ATP-binding cassette domain-containing protein [Conexibacter sp. DBS9H8]|uniref:ABC-F family ATP-binding cassette domain-containing protein n=1 Tax=Conexibacter sp. DBS9H8 TaxID=2937801 RepID=UPI00200DBCC4|nr:ABC-F family ATP-binding cassette domain-containing protein [Conexibacter sp. DBS9H8]
MAAAHNLVNLSRVGKGFAARTVLEDVTLGIAAGDRIGIVGENGQGKSTLLGLLAGELEPDTGQVVQRGSLSVGTLRQGDDLDRHVSVEAAVVGDRAEHEWAADADFRDVLSGLLGGVEFTRLPAGRATRTETLSGGERRRIALAALLLTKPELLLLDEPTNHLDVEAIAWLAAHLRRRSGAMVIVTHDRWFLDAVVTGTWEVADTRVHRYEGGYSAYVLARAERARQGASVEARRQQLIRKELAWLRRGPPARTSKPKFRIEAANALIADEPPARNRVELLAFAHSRLGKTALEAEQVSFGHADVVRLMHDLTWRIGPGDRVALVGVNGSGKTTLLELLAGVRAPLAGRIRRGETVRLAMLSQHTAELPGTVTVREAAQSVRGVATLAGGEQISVGKLLERFGFRGERLRTRVADLSGGERRRLALMSLLMEEPNVLILDEPTNDLDIDTLTALEDLLDGWPGTLIIVSHDRYFIERVCDDVFALAPGGGIRHLPGGVEQYLAELTAGGPVSSGSGAGVAVAAPGAGGRARETRKELARLERDLERAGARESELQNEMAAASADHVTLTALTATLQAAVAEREALEERWLTLSEGLEG